MKHILAIALGALMATSTTAAVRSTETEVAGWTIHQTSGSCAAYKRDSDFGLQISDLRFGVIDYGSNFDAAEIGTVHRFTYVFDENAMQAQAVRSQLPVPPFGNMLKLMMEPGWQTRTPTGFYKTLPANFTFTLKDGERTIATVDASGSTAAFAELDRCMARIGQEPDANSARP